MSQLYTAPMHALIDRAVSLSSKKGEGKRSNNETKLYTHNKTNWNVQATGKTRPPTHNKTSSDYTVHRVCI